MLYAIFSEDVPESLPRRLQARPAHLERIQGLRAEGRLVLAGPHPALDTEDPGPAGFTGSVIIAEFASLADAKAWAAATHSSTGWLGQKACKCPKSTIREL